MFGYLVAAGLFYAGYRLFFSGPSNQVTVPATDPALQPAPTAAVRNPLPSPANGFDGLLDGDVLAIDVTKVAASPLASAFSNLPPVTGTVEMTVRHVIPPGTKDIPSNNAISNGEMMALTDSRFNASFGSTPVLMPLTVIDHVVRLAPAV